MGNWAEEGLLWLITQQKLLASSSPEEEEQSHRARVCFQWGGTLSAIFLLILNHKRRRSSSQTSLLVVYLLSSLPTLFFNIIRGQFGQWVAFPSIAFLLLSPYSYPGINISTVSRSVLIIIAPSSLAHGLHDSIAGGVLCLVIGMMLLLEEIRETGGFGNCKWDLHCFRYCLGISFLFFFTILYLFMGPW